MAGHDYYGIQIPGRGCCFVIKRGIPQTGRGKHHCRVKRRRIFFCREENLLEKQVAKDHATLLIALCVMVLAAAILPLLIGMPYLAGTAPVIGVIAYGWQNNRMMAYIEEHLYGDGVSRS